ncbi:MAG: FAD-dependent oxidoreductase [Myxococcales bacterium]|nr:FAD-dependent oxidoreductase [Myxococcales bacterium]
MAGRQALHRARASHRAAHRANRGVAGRQARRGTRTGVLSRRGVDTRLRRGCHLGGAGREGRHARRRCIAFLIARRTEKWEAEAGRSDENHSTEFDHAGTLANVSGSVHQARVTSIRQLAKDVVEYVLALAEDDVGLAWRPGQFISIACGRRDDGEPILRSYSIASLPGCGTVDLVVKLIEGGAASDWFRRLQEGEAVRFTGPMGFFVLDLVHPGDLVFAATGTGVAPLVPMIREALGRDEGGRVHLLWGLRSEEDLFWRAEIEALAALSPRFQHAIHLSRPGDGWAGARGRINGAAIELLPSLARPTFYLCGNGAMIKDLKAALCERGIDRKRQVRTEAFFDG